MKTKTRVGVVGASGYAGGELVSLLMRHPHVEIAHVTSSEWAGKRLEAAHPHLRGMSELVFQPHPDQAEAALFNDMDLVFLAVPHGKSMKLLPSLPSRLKVVDLTGDYRIQDAAQFKKYYGYEQSDQASLAKFVYGLSEVNRNLICEAHYVANPGCFATAIQLALYPLVQQDLIEGGIIIDAKTGSSGSGHTPSATTHHPVRSSGFCAYKPFSHQHMAEIEQLVLGYNKRPLGPIVLQTHSAPMVRGIFATHYLQLRVGMDADGIKKVFESAYGVGCPFIRYVDGSPNVAWVKHTNFVDIGWAVSERSLIVYSAIDNLVKGAAGQAVQNMNLMLGFDETTALLAAGGVPS